MVVNNLSAAGRPLCDSQAKRLSRSLVCAIIPSQPDGLYVYLPLYIVL